MTTDTSETSRPFFVAGGTVPPGSPSYVERAADRELYEALLGGEFCYVLNSRQMGKSSLAVRTIARLNDAGVRTAFVDLTRLGATGADPDRWYAGLLVETGRALGLRADAMAYLRENAALPPVARLFGFLRDLALDRIEEPVVLMLDEIDAVRSLPFPADDLFAGLRELWNARATDPTLARLAVCLLGTALPSDLIVDPRRTPFNIGRRIELRDFTAEEARPFAEVVGEAALDRVLHWTGGHPFLTQSLCAELAASPARAQGHPATTKIGDIDRLIRSRYLDARARETDTNLADVGRRLLGTGDPSVTDEDRATTLALYERMHRGKPVQDDESNPVAARIKMSGVARAAGGRLETRNRIYRDAFGRVWIRENTPGRELRRQRRAFWKGALRTGGISSVVLAVIGYLAWNNAGLARAANYEVYVAKMNLVTSAWGHGDLEALDRLLEETRKSDFRGWEWTYWKDVAQRGLIANVPSQNVLFPRLSPDGNHVAAVRNGMLRVYQISPFELEVEMPALSKGLEVLTWLPDGARLAEVASDGSCIIDLRSRRRTVLKSPLLSTFFPPSISPDGKFALVHGAGVRSNAMLWDLLHADAPPLRLRGIGEVFHQVFSASGHEVASAETTLLERSRFACRLVVRSFPDTTKERWSRNYLRDAPMVAWSPRGDLIATGSQLNGMVELLDASTGKLLSSSVLSPKGVSDLCFVGDGRRLIATSFDVNGAIYDVSNRRLQTSNVLRGAGWVSLSKDGRRMQNGLVNLRIVDTGTFLSSDSIKMNADGFLAATEAGKVLGARGDAIVSADLSSGTTVRIGKLSGRIVAGSVGSSQPWGIVQTARAGLALVDLRTGKVLLRIPQKGLTGLIVCSLGVDRVAVPRERGVDVWDLRSSSLVRRLPLSAHVSTLAYSKDTDSLAVATESGDVTIFEGRDLRRSEIRRAGAYVLGIRFFESGEKIVAACGDNGVEVWTLRNPRLVMRCEGHANTVMDVALSPDESRIASAGVDGTIRIWDARTGKQTTTIEGVNSDVVSIAFCKGGAAIQALSLSGEAKIFGGWDRS